MWALGAALLPLDWLHRLQMTWYLPVSPCLEYASMWSTSALFGLCEYS